MDTEHAMTAGLNYAWGREDASGMPTLNGVSKDTPSFAFSMAYAQGWDDYNQEKRGNMIPVRDAYQNWQASGGTRVFKPGDSTAEYRERLAAYRSTAADMRETRKEVRP